MIDIKTARIKKGNKVKIEAQGLTKINRIKDVNFTLRPNDRLALIGPNGAGKTTLLQMLLGLIRPDHGKLNTDGIKFQAVFQGNLLDESLSIFQNLKFRVKNISELKKAQKMLSFFGLHHLKQKYGSLSGGEKRIVNFIRAMMSSPQVLVLDEMSAGMDVSIKHQVWQQINTILDRNRIALIYITHSLEELRYANSVLFLLNGRQKYFGSLKKFASQLPKYKLILYAKNNSLLETQREPQAIKFFETAKEALVYLNSKIKIQDFDFELKHTSFADLFLNIKGKTHAS